MQYALVNGEKSEPQKGLTGICIGCGNEMISKCGTLKMHHWAHRIAFTCDSWWETETEWHRDWKNNFPVANREISFYDESRKEHHRADVYTEGGLTIEFQNSPLSIGELESRERFYKKMIWVVNGLKFKGFNIAKTIPNPSSPLLQDYEFKGRDHLLMVRKTDLGNGARKIETLSLHHPELKDVVLSSQHHSFSWRHAHQSWYSAISPVFIDFGGHFLYWLREREQVGDPYRYLQLVSKKKFMEKYL